MSEIIQLLPNHLANQIAAGEVIQRPSSVVKELLENAIDADASEIKLIIKDAGKALIQVVDNGKGMSPMDARMSFERHATSKIKKIEDLFSIHTMGFRGEALASIAAVAQVELKTRQPEEEIGTHLIVEATEVKSQESAACPTGTNLIVKNLFYNIPARRKFLKSNTSEWKHIIEEFSRIAMANPNIAFRLFHNNIEQFHLNKGTLKTRIIGLLGNRAEKNLVSVLEETDLLKIEGYIGKPEVATKTRGNQFFFVNSRFIRSPYLNHAVSGAFEGLIDKAAYPFYVLFFEIDPQRVDVNVHPSKQEVKFDDESMLYAYLQSTVKHVLAKFNIAPSIDFSLNPEIQNLESVRLPVSKEQRERTQDGYLQHTFSKSGQAHFIEGIQERKQWQNQRETFFNQPPITEKVNLPFSDSSDNYEFPFKEESRNQNIFLCWGDYLISTVKSGVLLLHRKRALERITYENLKRRINKEQVMIQKLLFPIPFQVPPSELHLLEEAQPFLLKIGYELNSFGPNDFIIQGIPPDIEEGRVQSIIEAVFEQIKIEPSLLKDPGKERLLKIMAKRIAQPGYFSTDAAQSLVDELFACEQPQYAPDGKGIFVILSKERLSSII